MNGKERVLAMLDGQPVDHLPLMPITMMFAADLAGVHYRDYASDHRVLAEAQVATAEAFGFDHVSAISDPAREVVRPGRRRGVVRRPAARHRREPGAAGRQGAARAAASSPTWPRRAGCATGSRPCALLKQTTRRDADRRGLGGRPVRHGGRPPRPEHPDARFPR